MSKIWIECELLRRREAKGWEEQKGMTYRRFERMREREREREREIEREREKERERERESKERKKNH